MRNAHASLCLMWPIFPLLIMLFLSACGGRPEPKQAPRSPVSPAQCYASLDRLPGLKYRRLPDRQEGPACGRVAALQLLDVGVPMRGLGPMTCPMAAGVHRWLRSVAEPAAQRHMGARLVAIDTYGTYACRPRNNMAGARPSEHGTANAVDIAAFHFSDGRRVTVLDGWSRGSAAERAFLRTAHRGACGIFQVVIGPDGDRYHANHFHFDMGRWPYCR